MLDETLKKTLPDGGLSLPDSTPPENKLALALKDLSSLAAREGKVTGTAATASFFAERGINPEDLPGQSIGQMLAFVDRAMVDPVHKRAEAVGDILQAISSERQRIQQTAMTQMNTMMNEGMWNDLMKTNKTQATELWKAAGFYGDPYSIPETPAGKWPMEIKSAFPGRTLQESHDLLHSEKPPSWFINDEILANLTDAQKREFALVQELPAREQKSKPGFITSIEKTIGKTAQDSPDVWSKIPESRITESPKFQEFVQKEWLNARRNPEGYSQSAYEGPSDQMYNATLEKMNADGKTFKDKSSLFSYVSDINETQKIGLGVTQMNSVVDRILTEGLMREIPEDMISNIGDKLYETTSEYLKDKDIKETPESFMMMSQDLLENHYKKNKVQPYTPESLASIHEYIAQKYFAKEGASAEDKQKLKVNWSALYFTHKGTIPWGNAENINALQKWIRGN